MLLSSLRAFKSRLHTYPPLGQLVKQPHFSCHLVEQGFHTWHKLSTMWKASWGLSRWGNPTTSKSHSMIPRRLFLAEEWNFLPSLKEETKLPPPQGFFLKYECEMYLKQPLTPPKMQYHRGLPHLELIDLPLKLDSGQMSLSLKIINHATFALMKQLKTRHTFCQITPYPTPLKMSFHH